MTPDPESAPNGGARRAAGPELPAASGTPRRVADQRTFSSSLGWTVLGTLLPGLGLWRSGRRVVGALVLALFVLLVGGAATLYLTNQKLAQNLALQPGTLQGIAIALLVVAVVWVVVIGVSHLSLRPANPTVGQRAAGALVVGVLSFVVAAPMAVGANVAWTVGSLMDNVLGDDEGPNATKPTLNPVDPWKDKPQLNFLILGGDSGNDRSKTLGDRTDTVIVASIDTHTGATTLFTLPRNTARMPFPKDSPLRHYYPNGFYDGADWRNAEYFLNAMYRNAPAQVRDHSILGKTKNFAADVMKVSVGEALGLDLDYYILVNMDGFKDFVNAIGGITVNVNYRVPIGGQTDQGVKPHGYIEPGPNQHLNGRLALWYARGRYGLDDYKRMERQRCVINAVVQQSTPATVLQNFQAIAAAGEKSIVTDVPRTLLPDLLDVGVKVKGTKLRSVVFTPSTGFNSGNPDWADVRKKVRKALKETASGVQPKPSATATPSGSSSPSSKPTKKPTAKAKSDDLEATCGYHPEKP